MDDDRNEHRAPERAGHDGEDAGCRRSGRFVQYVVIWAIRNWARGEAGQVNVHRELEAALSPVAARIACAAFAEIVRLLARESERPILIRPVLCHLATDDEHRMAILCRAVLAGDGSCARRVAAELVRAPAVDALVDHAHTALIAILDGNLPARTERPPSVTPLTMH